MLVAGVMVLLPLVYFGIIAGMIWLVVYHATHDAKMVTAVRNPRVFIFMGLIFLTPIFAGTVVVACMIVAMFSRSKKGPRPYWVDKREEPLLFEYVERLCSVMRAPKPNRIEISADAGASVHFDNGLAGLIRRRLVLTIGLPLARSMDLRQFTGVLAHEIGHFTQGSSMRLSYAVHRINAWFWRMAYERGKADELLDSCLSDDNHWSFMMIAGICKLIQGLVRLVLKVFALLSHVLTMNLSRQDEFDADSEAARIVGGESIHPRPGGKLV